jgi:hypothetical protein
MPMVPALRCHGEGCSGSMWEACWGSLFLLLHHYLPIHVSPIYAFPNIHPTRLRLLALILNKFCLDTKHWCYLSGDSVSALSQLFALFKESAIDWIRNDFGMLCWRRE